MVWPKIHEFFYQCFSYKIILQLILHPKTVFWTNFLTIKMFISAIFLKGENISWILLSKKSLFDKFYHENHSLSTLIDAANHFFLKDNVKMCKTYLVLHCVLLGALGENDLWKTQFYYIKWPILLKLSSPMSHWRQFRPSYRSN